jgi:HrpA-like RNA helicase
VVAHPIQEGYKTQVDQQAVYIHPSSALYQRQPDWCVYHELVMTTKEYMREVTAIDPKVIAYVFLFGSLINLTVAG